MKNNRQGISFSQGHALDRIESYKYDSTGKYIPSPLGSKEYATRLNPAQREQRELDAIDHITALTERIAELNALAGQCSGQEARDLRAAIGAKTRQLSYYCALVYKV